MFGIVNLVLNPWNETFFVWLKAKEVEDQFKTSVDEVSPVIKCLDKSVQVCYAWKVTNKITSKDTDF